MAKICKWCKEDKPLESFGLHRQYKDGRRPECKECRNSKQRYSYPKNRGQYANRWYKYKYGISLEDVDNILNIQDGKCAICSDPFTEDNKPQIDHCHSTSNVRGALCKPCNLGLGGFKDNKENLMKAIKYLEASEVLV